MGTALELVDGFMDGPGGKHGGDFFGHNIANGTEPDLGGHGGDGLLDFGG